MPDRKRNSSEEPIQPQEPSPVRSPSKPTPDEPPEPAGSEES